MDLSLEKNVPRLRTLEFAPFKAELARITPALEAKIARILSNATILDVQTALKRGEFTSEGLTLFFLARIQRHDDTLRSYTEINPEVIGEARAADARRKVNKARGPLDGIPISIKDNIETAGPMHTTAGAEVLLQHIARVDAVVVANLRRAGAVLLGKANLSELAGAITYGWGLGGSSAVAGQTKNAFGEFPSGGSSSGSAVAVSTLLAMASVGTETVGSLITPSAWSGVVGMKPSLDRVSSKGVVPLYRFNDSPGPICRSVTDAALLLDALEGRGAYDVRSLKRNALDGVSVGLLSDSFNGAPGNEALLQTAVTGLTAAGARIHPAAIPKAGEEPLQMFNRIVVAGGNFDMVGYISRVNPSIKSLRDLLAYNGSMPERRAPFGQALLLEQSQKLVPMTRKQFQSDALRFRRFAAAGLDEAFRKSRSQVLVSLDNIDSLYYASAGYPAITVPLGLRENDGGFVGVTGINTTGMPAGITLIGKCGADSKLLAFAYAFEQATRLRTPPRMVK
ncbi:MAG: hypothetical protein K1X67_02840 [Fimbriimonadaceae bacterium]|nr:hypothetical protein [Fimbriimonadaceae bacterium]